MLETSPMSDDGEVVVDRADRAVRLAPVIATVFAAVAGGVELVRRPGLWIDEGWSVSVAARSLGGTLEVIAHRERNMALYYVLLHFWAKVSDDPRWLSALSLLFAVAIVPATAWVGHLLGGRRVAAVAALVTAANMGLVTYSVEVRAYALGVLLAVLTVGSFVQLVRTGRPRWGVAFTVLACATVATLLLSVLLLVALGLVAIVRPEARRPPVLSWLTVTGLVLAPGVLWALATDKGAIAWIPRPTLRAVADVPLLLCGGKVGILVVGVLLALFVVTSVKRGAGLAHVLVLSWLVVPSVLLLVTSFAKPMLQPRYLLFIVPAIGLAAGLLLARHARGVLVGAVVAVVLAAGGSTESLIVRDDDLTAAAAYVVAHQQAGDALAYDPSDARAWYGHYLGSWASTQPRPRDLALAEGGSPFRRGDVYADEVTPAEVVTRAAAVRRLWVITYPGWGITGQTTSNFRMVRAEVLAGRQLAGRHDFGSAVVALYVLDE